MTPDQRALHDAEVSLQRQKRDMELRHEAETQSLYMSVEEDMVNRFRASIRESSRPPARPPTAREEVGFLRYTARAFSQAMAAREAAAISAQHR